MPPPNPKNFGLSPAAQDLGLGSLTTQELQDDLEERRKKKLRQGDDKEDPMASSNAVSMLLGSY